jgi:hypothetical protein
MYIDPTLGRPLLEPLFRLQAPPNYSIPFAASDLGASHSQIYRVSYIERTRRIKISQYHRQQVSPQPRSRTFVDDSSFLFSISLNHIWCTESGNMLIMTYAHARATGDGSLISRYVSLSCSSSRLRVNQLGQYPLLTTWANYLINTLLFVHDQYVVLVNVLLGTDNGLWDRASADGWTAANQTNLAIKGIIAIQAMSEMSIIVDQVTEAKNYSVRTNL